VIVFHAPRDLSGDDAATTDAFEAGFVDGLKSGEAEVRRHRGDRHRAIADPVVQGPGATERRTTWTRWPDMPRWCSSCSAPTVSYGEKDSAQALLPNSAGG
jgi:hypothetical protein